MGRVRCTPVDSALEEELLAAFPQYLTPDQEDRAELFFPQYLFYEPASRKERWVYCTVCGQGGVVDRRREPELFRHKHGDRVDCPYCFRRVELKALNKYRTLDSLSSREPVVQLKARGERLLMQGGWVRRSLRLDGGLVTAELYFEPCVRYVFAPGLRLEWKHSIYNSLFVGRRVYGEWTRTATVGEPIPGSFYAPESAYWVLGWEALAQSSMKWCQYDKWFNDAYGCELDTSAADGDDYMVAWLASYLAEYTRRPQLEMLVKLGHSDVVTDLVKYGHAHPMTLNWRARDPAAFFRLSKTDYRAFQASGLTLNRLEHMLELGGRDRLSEFLDVAKRAGGYFDELCRCASKAGVELRRAERYIGGQGYARTELWSDYLDAARTLGYDLSRDDVRLPKDLRALHDAATAAVRVKEDAAANRRYRKRRRKLEEQFAFEADGLRVVVPSGVSDIVQEGKALCHCVGGYAHRHTTGAVTILFLRRAEEPETPYVTMELTVDSNCSKLRIRQIHGYQNDRGRQSPEEVHAGFLERWLAWVHDGSPRDVDGRPKEKIEMEVGAA